MTLGERIKQVAAERDIKHQEIARRTGIARSQLNRYLNGTNEPSWAKLALIARALAGYFGRLLRQP